MPVMFVDEFDQEHSRDIEPMLGGHGDDYYYQLAGYARRHKGVRQIAKATRLKEEFDLLSDLKAWDKINPEFRDDRGDVLHRDFPGYAGHTQYTNHAPRHDFVLMKTAVSPESVWFYLKTAEPILESRLDGVWLLVDADQKPGTGWEGFDLVINRLGPAAKHRFSIEKNTGMWSWEKAGEADYRLEGNELVVKLPKNLVGDASIKGYDFKWSDRMPENGDIVSWLLGGDTAPNGRFRYRAQFE
jgi:hypothetical protein